ncbi:uncharacterized protein LOC111013765 isoform X2 [Momordica charantia]|uniref:Uncharacterized protein LOC111013765 isoform X2 n=1 Tax=Momordica charantia TaxID=3673 RepID=A0A6J1CSE0_MOMCH|nr:uncharacterized protein LOC111013765 isoform X2 [Momordica charantia]
MASTPQSHQTTTPNGDPKTRGGAAASYFQKTVCLHDWWLIRAENDFNRKTLAVAGLTSRPEQPVRVFSSAPIVKRYDVFTLETADGICVVIKGFINKLRTTDNGFTDEVFKHFVFGFPPNWETYAENYFEGEAFDSASAAGNISDTDNLLCKSKNACINNCTFTNINSPLCENCPNGSPVENDARQELDHGDTMAQDVMQNASATKTAVPLKNLVGSPHKTGANIQGEEIENKRKGEQDCCKQAKRKILFISPGSGIRQRQRQREEKICIKSPESLSYGRSRSGRLLLPAMEFWRNQLPVYDADRRIRGIQEGLPMPED